MTTIEKHNPTAGEGAAQARAFGIQDFCSRYGVSRTRVYEEIRGRRLPAIKSGRRTLIKTDDAERWLASLPPAGRSAVA